MDKIEQNAIKKYEQSQILLELYFSLFAPV